MPRKRPFAAEDLLRIRTVSDPQVSPDGSRVAFVVAQADREKDEMRSHIWTVPAEGGAPAQFTRGAKRDHSPRWSPDGSLLAFVSDRNEKSQIWLIRAQGGEAWQLTHGRRSASHPVWSPDGRRLAFTSPSGGDDREEKEKSPAERAEPRTIREMHYRLDGVGYFGERHVHIWTVPAEGGEAKKLTDGDWNDTLPVWSPDGSRIAFMSYREQDRHYRRISDIWVAPSRAGRARKLTRSRGAAGLPVWSPDGRWVAFVGHERGEAGYARTNHLCVVRAAGGAPRVLTAELDRTVLGWPVPLGQSVAWAPDSAGLYFLASDRGNVPLFRVGLNDRRISRVLEGERQITSISLSADGRTLAFAATSASDPGDIYVTSPKGRGERRLTDVNADLMSELRLPEPERISYRAPDGLPIEGWVLKPPGFRRGVRYPVILEVHGGPHAQHGNMFSPRFHHWAAQGYVVLLLNPRGSLGYGEEFSMGCVQDWGGKDYEDLMAGVDHVIEQGYVDPKRMAVAGYSYGGYMTNWIVGHTNRFKAALSGACVANLVSDYGTTDIPTFDEFEFGGDVFERFDLYWERSPVAYARNVQTPVLIVHHEGDLRCPISQSEEMFAALKRLGRDVEFVRYPGGFHQYITHSPSQRVDDMIRSRQWFDRYLRPTKAGSRRRQAKVGGTAAS